MTFSLLTPITFSLLAISIVAAWFKFSQICGRTVYTQHWQGLFLLSMITGLIAGVLSVLAVIEISVFCGVAYLSMISQRKSKQRIFFTSLTVVMALALALHRLPGFHNPVIISNMVVSIGAMAFTQYANFDKGVIGLVFLVFMCNRSKLILEDNKLIKQTLLIAVITIVILMSTAMLVGYVRPDFKFTEFTILFLVVNLFFTVIAEEVFFRGFLQDRLATSIAHFRYGRIIAVLCSAILFGLVHIAGGAVYVFLATLGGMGYAYAYHVTRRIEAPIFIHFMVNAIHFIGFTYPHL